jgi:hypothetical protein
MNLWGRFYRVVETVYRQPLLLRGEGSSHEASFERLLRHHGIFPISAAHPSAAHPSASHPFASHPFAYPFASHPFTNPSRHRIPSPTIGYERHPNGAERWPDFHLQDERTLLPIELKTTSRDTVHIGKTWIHSEALYLIHHRPSDSIFLSWGKDMKTEEDDRRFREFQYHIRSMNRDRSFTPSVQWSASVQTLYRLDRSRRHDQYERVMEELRLLSKRR